MKFDSDISWAGESFRHDIGNDRFPSRPVFATYIIAIKLKLESLKIGFGENVFYYIDALRTAIDGKIFCTTRTNILKPKLRATLLKWRIQPS